MQVRLGNVVHIQSAASQSSTIWKQEHKFRLTMSNNMTQNGLAKEHQRDWYLKAKKKDLLFLPTGRIRIWTSVAMFFAMRWRYQENESRQRGKMGKRQKQRQRDREKERERIGKWVSLSRLNLQVWSLRLRCSFSLTDALSHPTLLACCMSQWIPFCVRVKIEFLSLASSFEPQLFVRSYNRHFTYISKWIIIVIRDIVSSIL